MNTATAQNQKGFTLVEIAIVLVIIGLLLGGVLKGQELITNAKIKSVTGDIEGITAAYYAYQDRTGLVPGDTAAAPGDGKVDSDIGFWNNLRSEGFISGVSGASGPKHDLDGVFVAGNGGMFTGKNYLCAPNIKASVAQGMDVKFDDGASNTGIMQAGPETTAGTAVTTSTATAYTQTAATVTVCREL
jgi:prepilin-type N-terminal cleavage/methylation domain-containing protein